MLLYSIYDKVAEEYGPVFAAVNDAVAQRNFAQVLKNDLINADDYSLYFLGYFYNRGSEDSVIIKGSTPRIIPCSVSKEVSDVAK